MAILATIAVPSFRQFIQSSQLTGHTNDIVGAVNFARSTALTESVRVIACPSSNNTACSTSVGWSDGWIMFVDCNEDGDLDASSAVCANASNERMLRQGTALSDVTVDTPGNASLQYESNGRVASARTFTVCVGDMDEARQVQVSVVGRAQVLQIASAGNC